MHRDSFEISWSSSDLSLLLSILSKSISYVSFFPPSFFCLVENLFASLAFALTKRKSVGLSWHRVQFHMPLFIINSVHFGFFLSLFFAFDLVGFRVCVCACGRDRGLQCDKELMRCLFSLIIGQLNTHSSLFPLRYVRFSSMAHTLTLMLKWQC